MYIGAETKRQVENCSWIMEHNLMYFKKNEISNFFIIFFSFQAVKTVIGLFPTLSSALYIVGKYLILYEKWKSFILIFFLGMSEQFIFCNMWL